MHTVKILSDYRAILIKKKKKTNHLKRLAVLVVTAITDIGRRLFYCEFSEFRSTVCCPEPHQTWHCHCSVGKMYLTVGRGNVDALERLKRRYRLPGLDD